MEDSKKVFDDKVLSIAIKYAAIIDEALSRKYLQNYEIQTSKYLLPVYIIAG